MLAQSCNPGRVVVRPNRFVPFTPAVNCTRNVVRRVGPVPNPEALKKAMQDPELQKKMQAMMQDPQVQKQMSEMAAVLQNQQLQQRMQALRNDPEFAEIFAEIQKGGMQALMKYYNDPTFLSKLGEKIGDVAPPAGAAQGAAPPAAAMPGAAPPAPEINNIRDAAKYGDEEAVEDFIAVGKDINEADREGRTALHYSVAFDHPVISKMLIDEGANLDARDSKDNTPLHYACGYGRVTMARMLLDAGADKTVQNCNGKTPLELAKLDSRNPVGADEDLVKRLQA